MFVRSMLGVMLGVEPMKTFENPDKHWIYLNGMLGVT